MKSNQNILLLSLFICGIVFSESYQPAINACMKGRCEMGECDTKKLPAYSLGLGYTCDVERLGAYQRCREKNNTTDVCNKIGNEVKKACLEKPCPYVYSQCVRGKCKRDKNEWDCWKLGKNGSLEFGYYEISPKNVVEFFPVKETEQSDADWKKICERKRKRCEHSLEVDTADVVLPISDDFCSAKCYGHNCHHAANNVCSCLEGKGIKDIKVVVLDPSNNADDLPSPVGNIFHSMLTIPHPDEDKRKLGYRCLIESELSCERGFDPNCCFKDMTEFHNMHKNKCSFSFTGPKKEKRNFSVMTIFKNCKTFLDERGTKAGETVKTKPITGTRINILGTGDSTPTHK